MVIRSFTVLRTDGYKSQIFVCQRQIIMTVVLICPVCMHDYHVATDSLSMESRVITPITLQASGKKRQLWHGRTVTPTI